MEIRISTQGRKNFQSKNILVVLSVSPSIRKCVGGLWGSINQNLNRVYGSPTGCGRDKHVLSFPDASSWVCEIRSLRREAVHDAEMRANERNRQPIRASSRPFMPRGPIHHLEYQKYQGLVHTMMIFNSAACRCDGTRLSRSRDRMCFCVSFGIF